MRPAAEFFSGRRFALLFVILFVTSPAWAVSENILTSFVANPNGANPQSNLIADAAGNLYGTTYYGGRFGVGTVFQLQPGENGRWTESVLYNFTGSADGRYPIAGLVLDTAGNLYGTTVDGGSFSGNECSYQGCGVVFELSPGKGTWTETVLHSFTGPPNDGANPKTNLVLDAAGNLYGTAGMVFELSPSQNGGWTETILYSFTDFAGGEYPTSGLILDSKGNLYGVTEFGGNPNCENLGGDNQGCGVVFELSNSGNGTWTESVLHTFDGNDGAFAYGNLTLDSSGNLYGTTTGGPGSYCSEGCGTVFRVSPNQDGSWTETVLYIFAGGPDGINPVGNLLLDDSGDLYGVTQGGGSDACYYDCGIVFELTPKHSGNWTETIITRFAPTNLSQPLGDAPAGGLLRDSQGNLYGTASLGGSFQGPCSSGGCGTVFKITSLGQRWSTNVIYAFPPSLSGLVPQAGLLSDSAGDMFGTTVTGGKGYCSYYGCGTIFEMQAQPSGVWKNILLHAFDGASEGAGPESSLISDSSGNLYGTAAYGGDAYCTSSYESPCGGTVFELTPAGDSWQFKVLHHFRGYPPKALNDDGAVPEGSLLMDSQGNLYGTTAQGGFGGPYCSDGYYIGCGTVYELSPADGGAWNEQVLYRFQAQPDADYPNGPLVMDSQGALYGTSCYGGAFDGGAVFKLTPNGNGAWSESIIYSFGSQKINGFCPEYGVVFDSQGNLYGAAGWGGSYENNCSQSGCGLVFELQPSGQGLWSEKVLYDFQGTDGSSPVGPLTFDASGNLYGSTLHNVFFAYDYYSGAAFVLTPNGRGWTKHTLHIFGNGFDGAGPNGGLIVDSAGNIFGTTRAGGEDNQGSVFVLTSLDGDWGELTTASPPPQRASNMSRASHIFPMNPSLAHALHQGGAR